ncbi:hypothetical protein DFP94_101107 [Fontibacillus phaseoli]|uniref:ABC transporter family protein n=1 Tax=Fontibacillus phaseoli TaxID=1416533 RepID=A0A369BPZ7_9BACL|nr:hypothetical protein DFP94_101107 [Fontibacillus phaseoli]
MGFIGVNGAGKTTTIRGGLIHSVPGEGCFVADFPPGEMLRIRNEMVTKQLAGEVSYYKSFGLTLEEMVELLKKVY